MRRAVLAAVLVLAAVIAVLPALQLELAALALHQLLHLSVLRPHLLRDSVRRPQHRKLQPLPLQPTRQRVLAAPAATRQPFHRVVP